MKQIDSLGFQKSNRFYKQFKGLFLIALFSAFSFIYSNNAYTQGESKFLLPLLNLFDLHGQEKEIALKLAKKYVETAGEAVSILEEAGAGRKLLKVARERYQVRQEDLSIVEGEIRDYPTPASFPKTQYGKIMLKKKLLLKAEGIMMDLTALKLAQEYVENDKQLFAFLTLSGGSKAALKLAEDRYKKSMKIASIVKENSRGVDCSRVFH